MSQKEVRFVFLPQNHIDTMANPFFTFKKFTVYHDRCAMKVGTDGVLLGTWTDISSSSQILDIGTGTGLIALILAQRCPTAQIKAVDIDNEAISQARENVSLSPWKENIKPLLQDIRTFTPNISFDTIVSNPPYFIQSLKCPDKQRNTARHTDTLNAENLLTKVVELLSPKGKFSIILPTEQTSHLIETASHLGLYPSRITSVITRPGLPPKRTLMEFRKSEVSCQTNELLIELSRHVYSQEYIELTKDFYLKF